MDTNINITMDFESRRAIEALAEALSGVENLTINIPDRPINKLSPEARWALDDSCEINISDIISKIIRRR